MSLDASDIIRLRAAIAVLSANRHDLMWASSQTVESVGEELMTEVLSTLEFAAVPGQSRLLRVTVRLPAWMQYMGQRAVLLFPRIARRILRATGLHHQMY